MAKEDVKRYRAQIAGAKRQLTIPPQMMAELRLESGDFIEFVVSGHRIVEAHPCKPIPITNLSTAVLDSLREGSNEFAAGECASYDSAELLDAELTRRRVLALKDKEG
jgi:bifunctional DNA-binding transcriptional regulator/antitoxin component of YhaV-PrlF toxin-antitoxin module